MISFVLNQNFPFSSPLKSWLYEAKLLRRKEAQVFTIIQSNVMRRKIEINIQNFLWVPTKEEKSNYTFLIHYINCLFSTGKRGFSETILAIKTFAPMQYLNEVLLEALDAFKNFWTSISSTRNLNFWFISIGSDFSKNETVVGHILQSDREESVLILFLL